MEESEYVDQGAAAGAGSQLKTADDTVSLESQQAQLEAAQRTSGSMPTGWAAKGYSKDYAEILDAENEKVRREWFQDNPKGYEQWLVYARFTQAARLEGAMRYEAAQLRHAATVEADAQAANLVTQTRRTVSEQGMAAQAEKWAAIEAAQREKADSDAKAKLTFEEAESKIGTGADADFARTVNKKNLEISMAETEKKYAEVMKGADATWVTNSERLFAHVDESMKKLYGDVVQNAVNNGASPFVAKAKAEAAVRSAAVGLLSGMVEDGNHELFDRWAKRLAATEIIADEDDGKGGKVVVNEPMRRWCLGRGDIKKAQDALLNEIASRQRRQKLLAEAYDTKASNYVESLRVAGSQIMSKASITADDDSAVDKIITGLNKVVTDPGTSKAVAKSAREAIEHLLSKRDARGQRETRIAAKVARMKTEQDAVDLMRELDGAGSVTRTVVLLGGDGERDKAKEVSADIRHVKRYVIQSAQAKGFLKGASWSARLRQLDETTQEDVDEQSKAFDAVRKSLGLHVLTKDEDSDRALSGFRKRKDAKQGDAFSEMLQIDESAGRYVTKNRNATWRWTDSDGVGYDLSADAVNALLSRAADFQRLHADAKTADLVEFMTRTLRDAARDADIEDYTKWWDFSGRRKMRGNRASSADIDTAARIVRSQMLNDGNSASGVFASFERSGSVVVDSASVRKLRGEIRARDDAERRELKELREKKRRVEAAKEGGK